MKMICVTMVKKEELVSADSLQIRDILELAEDGLIDYGKEGRDFVSSGSLKQGVILDLNEEMVSSYSLQNRGM
jgi:hypothetical protein